jgi:hypothetical protein
MIAGLAENVKSLFCNPNAKNNFELFGFVVIYWVFNTHFVSLVFEILLYITMQSKLKKLDLCSSFIIAARQDHK